MQIGPLNIDPPILLAPLAGVTDYPFRILCKEQGAALVYSEFVSAHGIIRENAKTLDMIAFAEEERPIGIQIFGDDPRVMADAARLVYQRFQPDLIDINYGCPVPKVTKRGAGSAALKDLCLMDDITVAVVEAVPEIPVTVKMRSGWDAKSCVIPAAGPRLEQAGVKAITLHPRTTKQSYDGQSDWSQIRELKDSVTIPVIGNGDVRTGADLLCMRETTGCAGVMIGRAALGNPFIFRELIAAYRNEPIPVPPTREQLIATCRRHLEFQVAYHGKRVGCNLMRKHFGWYLKGFTGAAAYRQRLVTAPDLCSINAILHELDFNEQCAS